MKKIILMFLILLSSSYVQAATYYVRPDGGTASQCSGLADAKYSGSGLNQACSFSHPNWAIAPQGNNPSKMVGGDTLIISGDYPGQYMMGYGSPNTTDTSKCSTGWPWDCILRPIPSGPSPSNPTRILGKGWDGACTSPPQLWGNEHLAKILNLNGSNNIEIQCLEITDHSACQEQGPVPCNRSTYPYGPWASVGIEAADSANVLLKNINIHGMAHGGVHAGRLKDWTITGSKIVANPFVGWDGDIGTGISSNSGTITFDKTAIQYSGCGETYPGKLPYNCFSQDQGGYGDGLGTQQTGGNWVFNAVDVSHNVSDGIDLLYHDGTGKVTVSNSTVTANAGNQIKSATSTDISNTTLDGNCAFFKNNPIAWLSSGFNNCRAQGDVFVNVMPPGSKSTITNSKFLNVLHIGVISGGKNCNGTESITSTGTTFDLKPQFSDPSSMAVKYYATGATGNGDGPCGAVKFIENTPPPACVPNGSCSAIVPTCGTTTTGVDNCGAPCTKVGAVCPPQCPVCPVCPPPTLDSVTVNIKSGDKTYSFNK